MQNIALQSKFTYQAYKLSSNTLVHLLHIACSNTLYATESYLSALKNRKTWEPWKEPVFVILTVYFKKSK